MNWMIFLEQLFNLAIYPIIGIAAMFVCYFFSVKIAELKQKTNNDVSKKYLDMLDNTITNAVLSTTQTYVESLKKQGKFDADAQKQAFNMTYEAVIKVLNDEAKKYLTTAVGDLDTYITNKIEAEVKINK